MNRRQRLRRARIRRAVLLAPFVLVAALGVVGLLLPAERRDTISVWLPGSPDAVWAVLTDLDQMPDWRRDLTALERLPSRTGSLRWREIGQGGALAFERVEAVAPTRLVVRLVDPAGGARQWTYRIRAASPGAELAVEEVVRIDNPFRRALTGLFGLGRGRARHLNQDLAKRLNARHEFAVQTAGQLRRR